MSWSNPTPDEAAEAYSYYKNKYYTAATQKQQSEKQEQSYVSQRKSASAQIVSLSSQTFSLEKRLNGVIRIIRMLEGNGGFLTADVPHAIDKMTAALNKADESYRKSIKLSGTSAASLAEAFKTQAVEENVHSASALHDYKVEQVRLEQQIAEIKAQINSQTELVASLTKKINACNVAQLSLRASMNSYAYEMNHFKKHMY